VWLQVFNNGVGRAALNIGKGGVGPGDRQGHKQRRQER